MKKQSMQEIFSEQPTWEQLSESLMPDQVINELMRISSIKQQPPFNQLEKISMSEAEALLEIMRDMTNDLHGMFWGDAISFRRLYNEARGMDILRVATKIICGTEIGVFSESDLIMDLTIDYLKQCITNKRKESKGASNYEKVLLYGVDQYMVAIPDIVKLFPESRVTLIAHHHKVEQIMQSLYNTEDRVQITTWDSFNIQNNEKYSLILGFPIFGYLSKPSPNPDWRTIDTIEEQTTLDLLSCLDQLGDLLVKLPYRHATQYHKRREHFRTNLTDIAHVSQIIQIDSWAMRLHKSLETMLLHISKIRPETVQFTKARLKAGKPVLEVVEEMPYNEFMALSTWDMDNLQLSPELEAYQRSALKKQPLAVLVSQIIKGKVIRSEHYADEEKGEEGNAYVLNIKDMDDNEINLEDLKQANIEEKDITKHQVKQGDLIITVRGTNFKSAILREGFAKPVIISSNLMALAFKDSTMAEYVNLFFQSDMGRQVIETMYLGSTIMNLGYKQVNEMEIPMVTDDKRDTMVQQYLAGQQEYLQRKKEVEERWEKVQEQVYNQFFHQ